MLSIRGCIQVSKLKVPDPQSPLFMPITTGTLLSSMQEVSLLADRKQMVQGVLSDKRHPHFPNKLRHKIFPLSCWEMEN